MPSAVGWPPATSARAGASAWAGAHHPIQAPVEPRSVAAAAQAAGSRQAAHWELEVRAADAERRAWVLGAPVVDCGRASAGRKAVDPKRMGPALRRPHAAVWMPAMAADRRARSNQAFGFRDRSPSAPATTIAPRRRRCDRARRANRPRTAEFRDGWAQIRLLSRPGWLAIQPGRL